MAMLQLEVVGMSPRTGGPVKIGYPDRSVSVTPSSQRHAAAALLPLARRGLSRVTQYEDLPSSALEPVDDNSLPKDFSKNVQNAILSYNGTPSSSGRSSPTITEELHSTVSHVQGCWTTGNTTERSSVDSNYSWDEFDRQAAKTVQDLFDEIDSVLYEQRSNKANYIYNECQEWGSQFPHLRILGRQLLSPQDSGYHLVERDVSRPSTTSSMGLMDVTEQDMAATQDGQGLSIAGRGVKAVLPPLEIYSRSSGISSDSLTSEYSHLEEEVFDSEGQYEEIIAIDYRDIYEDTAEHKKQLTPRRRRVGYPPITPNACVKDSVASSAFDIIWQEVISWIRLLLKKYSNSVLEDSKPLVIPLQDHIMLSRLADLAGPPSRETSILQKVPSQLSRAHTIMGPVEQRSLESPLKLEGVLQISRKPAHNRESSNLQDSSETQIQRPVSSIAALSRRPPSVRNPIRGGAQSRVIRLAPITGTGVDRSKTPNLEEENSSKMAKGALLVKKLTPHNGLSGRLSSPPAYNQRNGALPPIGMEIDIPGPSRMQKKNASSRASSAVEKPDIRSVLFRERSLLSQDARPSTTHAMRSDTPIGMSRRASTPFGQGQSGAFTNTVPRNPSYGPGGMALGIMGSGLQPSSDLGHLGNVPQEILEDTEYDEVPHANSWTPSTPSHNPYRRGRQISSLVRS